MGYTIDSSKYRWANRSDVVSPEDQSKTYRLIMHSYWIVNDMGDLLFWDNFPQCNSKREIAEAVLRVAQRHLDTHALVMYIDRAWVPVDPRDYC